MFPRNATRRHRHLLTLYVFAFLATMCLGVAASKLVVVFKGNETTVPYKENDGTVWDRKPLAFRVPAFVGGVVHGTEVLVTLCDARYNGWWDWDPIEVASKMSYGGYTQWGPAEIVVKNTRTSTKPVAGDATAVMKGDKVYVLVPSWDFSPWGWARHRRHTGWNPLMVVGTVKKAPEDGRMFVEWDAPVSLKALLPATAGGSPGAQFIGGVGNGVVMRDGTIVFPIQVSNTAGQVMSSIMYSRDDGRTWVMGSTTDVQPSECSVVEWGDGKLLLTTRVDNKPRRMYETDDMGATWREFAPLTGVWGNQPDRKGPGTQAGFITVPVDDTEVMLLSHPKNTKGGYIRDGLILWMTDGQRVFHVGEISEEGKGDRAGYSILSLVNNTLYCLYEINPNDARGNNAAPIYEWDRILALRELTPMLDASLVRAREWKAVDAELAAAGVPVNGLVGLLSESSQSAGEWVDTYGCVNAVVRNAVKVDGGLRFCGGADGGALWPVVSQGQNQRYYFTKRQFTIAATVSIDDITAKDGNSVLGASLDAEGRRVLLGLAYTNGGQWYAIHEGSKQTPLDVPRFTVNTRYHVALTFAKGVGSIYLNGTAVFKDVPLGGMEADIRHFYMGGYGHPSQDKSSQSTVRTVMLYNRPLSPAEIGTLVQYFVGVGEKKGCSASDISECRDESSGSFRSECNSDNFLNEAFDYSHVLPCPILLFLAAFLTALCVL